MIVQTEYSTKYCPKNDNKLNKIITQGNNAIMIHNKHKQTRWSNEA